MAVIRADLDVRLDFVQDARYQAFTGVATFTCWCISAVM